MNISEAVIETLKDIVNSIKNSLTTQVLKKIVFLLWLGIPIYLSLVIFYIIATTQEIISLEIMFTWIVGSTIFIYIWVFFWLHVYEKMVKN